MGVDDGNNGNNGHDAPRGVAPGPAGGGGARQLINAGPSPVLEIKRRRLGSMAIARPLLGDYPLAKSSDNLVEDAIPALNRLHRLWAISDADYSQAVADWKGLGSKTQLTGTKLAPLIKAIKQALEPTLSRDVANAYLPVQLSGGVGVNLPNADDDVQAVRRALVALRRLDPQFMNEPKDKMPWTLGAITSFKKAVAEASLGFVPLRADEALDGGDRFGGRTYWNVFKEFSVFVPAKAPMSQNFVHIFFAPEGIQGDMGSNNLLMSGIRAAFEDTKWILIAVQGYERKTFTISMSDIVVVLRDVQRASSSIDGLRLSAHSRGANSLVRCLNDKDPSSGTTYLDPIKIDRVTIFDSCWNSVGDVLRATRLADKSLLYRVTDGNTSGLPATFLNDWSALRAIAYARFLQDWMVIPFVSDTAPDVVPSGPIAAANRLLAGSPALPFRRSFSTQGGGTDLKSFCTAHSGDTEAVLRDLGDAFVGPQKLTQRDALGAGKEPHHFFVSEIVHEAVGP